MTAPLIADGHIGLYEHANAMAALPPEARASIQAAWASTGVSITAGGGYGVGEIGAATTNQAKQDVHYPEYFGGRYPLAVNMNFAAAHETDFTAPAGSAWPGRHYGGFPGPADQQQARDACTVARQRGARNIALVSAPNHGNEDLDDPFAVSPFWAPVRDIALWCGGLTIDAPPSYARARGPAYLAMIAQMLAWAKQQGLRAGYIVSPYAVQPDQEGRRGSAGFDTALLRNTQWLMQSLAIRKATPSQWIVESYDAQNGAASEQGIAPGEDPDQTLNGLALFIARNGRVSPPGRRAPAMPDGLAEAAVQWNAGKR